MLLKCQKNHSRTLKCKNSKKNLIKFGLTLIFYIKKKSGDENRHSLSLFIFLHYYYLNEFLNGCFFPEIT